MCLGTFQITSGIFMVKPCDNAMKYVLSLPAVSFKKIEVLRDKHLTPNSQLTSDGACVGTQTLRL